MDQDVINLAKAIRDRESGGNFNAIGDAGTSKGGYQWQPATWKEHSKKILGKDNAEMTPENQNAVAYGMIKTWKDKGLNPAQIAAKWNSGSETGWENKIGVTTINGKKIKYNVPQYVKDVTDRYQSYKTTASTPTAPQPTASEQADTASAEKYGATFPSKVGGSAVSEAVKTVGNIPKSAFNFAKGMLDVFNPVSTVNKIKEVVSGTKEFAKEQGGYGKAFGAIAKEVPKTAYESLVPEVGRALIKGDTETAQRAIVNDPFGQIAPFIFAAKGGAKVADTIATKRAMSAFAEKPFGKNIPKPSTKFNTAFETGMSKTSGLVTKPVGYAFGKVGRGITSATESVISQNTGLSSKTQQTIKNNPYAFTKEARATAGDRATLSQEVYSSLKKKVNDLSETGKDYNPIRQNKVPIRVESSFWDDVIKETTGLDIKKGKLTPKGSSKVRDSGDVRAVQKVYDFWKPYFKKGQLTSEEFLNLRKDLADAANFEGGFGKRQSVDVAQGSIRTKLNQAYRPQIKGLKELDDLYSAQRTELGNLRKGLLDKNNNLTESAINKIANATGKGKDALLNRLEQTVPGITKKIEILKAIEDMDNAGFKVGVYKKIIPTLGGYAAGGIVGAIVADILASPKIVVPILRRYGVLKNSKMVGAIVKGLREGSQIVNNPGETLSPYMNKDVKDLRLKAGMSIEDVSKPFSKKDLFQKNTFKYKTYDAYMENKYDGFAKASGLDKIGMTDDVVKWVDDWFSAKQNTPSESVIQKLEPYKPSKPTTIYSGNSESALKLTRKEPMSFTSDIEVAKEFGSGTRRDNPAIIKIENVNPQDIVVAIDSIPKQVLKALDHDTGYITKESEIITKQPLNDLSKKYEVSISKDGGQTWKQISGKSNFGR